MGEVLSESIGLTLAPETTLKTPPTAGWVVMQPNPGGIQGWEPKFKTVERDPLSKFATPEKGDNVGLDVDITLVHDWNKDLADMIGETMFRCTAKHAGNTSQSLYRPTAVTATGYTVPANGALTNGLLIYARGFGTSGNNGLKVLAGTSVATEIKTTGLTAEATPPANVTVDVCGVQGAAGDIQINGSGNLISTVLDFTTLGLQVGEGIKIGGTAANTSFTNQPTYNGVARITAIAANLITLERRTWTVGAADNGAGKTIQLFFGRFYRNYTLDSANYKKATLHGELEEQGPGTAGVATYTSAQGLALDTITIDAPLESKIVATCKLVGLDVPNPVLAANRIPSTTAGTGPGLAYSPQASALTDTATDLKRIRLTDTISGLSAIEVNSWKFSLSNSIKQRKVQATFGGVEHIYGKFMFSVSMECYYEDFNMIQALRDNRDMSWDAFAQNNQWGFLFDMPYVALRSGPRTFAANEPVMINCDVPGFRNAADAIAGSLTVFPFLP